jgi:hypothetical protein
VMIQFEALSSVPEWLLLLLLVLVMRLLLLMLLADEDLRTDAAAEASRGKCETEDADKAPVRDR